MKGVCPRPLTAARVCVCWTVYAPDRYSQEQNKEENQPFFDLHSFACLSHYSSTGSYLPTYGNCVFQRWKLLIFRIHP